MMLGLLYFIKLNLASDAELISNPPPLGKRLDIIERRFLRTGPRQAAFKPLIGQIVTLYHAPEMALALRPICRHSALLLKIDPLSNRRLRVPDCRPSSTPQTVERCPLSFSSVTK